VVGERQTVMIGIVFIYAIKRKYTRIERTSLRFLRICTYKTYIYVYRTYIYAYMYVGYVYVYVLYASIVGLFCLYSRSLLPL